MFVVFEKDSELNKNILIRDRACPNDDLARL